MKINIILFLILVISLQAFGQEKKIKNVGVIYNLSDSIYHHNRGITVFSNFKKVYPQADSLNIIIENQLDNEIKKLGFLNVDKLEYSTKEVRKMIKDSENTFSSYDMIMIIDDVGTPSHDGYVYVPAFMGRGILTSGPNRNATVYANLGVTLINPSNGKVRDYSYNFMIKKVHDSIASQKGYGRLKKKFFEKSSDKRKMLSKNQIIEIHKDLLDMYKMQTEGLFKNKIYKKKVFNLFTPNKRRRSQTF